MGRQGTCGLEVVGEGLLDQAGNALLEQGQGQGAVQIGGDRHDGEVGTGVWRGVETEGWVHHLEIHVVTGAQLARVVAPHVAVAEEHSAERARQGAQPSKLGSLPAERQIPRVEPWMKLTSSSTSGTVPYCSRTCSMAIRSGVPWAKSSR